MSQPSIPATHFIKPLLSPQDPAPYLIDEGENLDWLIVCDHASNRFPRQLGDLGLAPGAEQAHIAWDIGAAAIARRLAERLRAPLIRCNYSRLVVDCNRYTAEPDAMPAVSDNIAVPRNANLAPNERRARVAEIFRPYHSAIGRLLDHAEARGHVPVFLSIHSCNPVLGDAHRPWDIGLGWFRDARTASPLLAALRQIDGLVVGDNEPYGLDVGHDFTTPEHAMKRGLAHIQVEFRNDLVADEDAARQYADIFLDAMLSCANDPRWHLRETHVTPDDGIGELATILAPDLHD